MLNVFLLRLRQGIIEKNRRFIQKFLQKFFCKSFWDSFTNICMDFIRNYHRSFLRNPSRESYQDSFNNSCFIAFSSNSRSNCFRDSCSIPSFFISSRRYSTEISLQISQYIFLGIFAEHCLSVFIPTGIY